MPKKQVVPCWMVMPQDFAAERDKLETLIGKRHCPRRWWHCWLSSEFIWGTSNSFSGVYYNVNTSHLRRIVGLGEGKVGNSPPTPSLTQHQHQPFTLSKMLGKRGRRWVVCQNLIPIQFICTWLFSMFNLLQGTFGFLIFKVINSVNIESSVKYDDLSFNKFYT